MEKGDLDKKTLSDNDFLSWMNTTATATATTNDILMDALPLPLHHQQFDGNNCGGVNEISASHGGGGNSSILQPFHNFYPSGMAAEFPFTAIQWRELERQAMIYKCMISAVPVPPHLLFPIDSSYVPLYGDRYSRKGDAEPGRCKRTDGKKWWFSSVVAPQNKYCERHLHRGRPRSRKPVEPNKTRLPRTKSQIQPKSDPPISAMGGTTRDLPWEKPNLGLSGYDSCSFDQNYLFCFSAPEISGFTDMNSSWNRGSVESSEGDLSPSLNLSMTMGMAVGEEQMRNVIQRDWEALGLGPLGEPLQPASPYNSMSTPATSPSGVLHWNLFSHSDGSVCNSPSLAAEMANQWHI